MMPVGVESGREGFLSLANWLEKGPKNKHNLTIPETHPCIPEGPTLASSSASVRELVSSHWPAPGAWGTTT